MTVKINDFFCPSCRAKLPERKGGWEDYYHVLIFTCPTCMLKITIERA